MKKLFFFLSFLCAIIVSGENLRYEITPQGKLEIWCGKQLLLNGESLCLLSAKGDVVSRLQEIAPVIHNAPDGRKIYSWGLDIGSSSRTVETLKNGDIRILWTLKLLNGVVEARRLELAYQCPQQQEKDRKLRLKVTSESTPEMLNNQDWLVKHELEKQPFQMKWVAAYAPNKVNEYKLTITIGL